MKMITKNQLKIVCKRMDIKKQSKIAQKTRKSGDGKNKKIKNYRDKQRWKGK